MPQCGEASCDKGGLGQEYWPGLKAVAAVLSLRLDLLYKNIGRKGFLTRRVAQAPRLTEQ